MWPIRVRVIMRLMDMTPHDLTKNDFVYFKKLNYVMMMSYCYISVQIQNVQHLKELENNVLFRY